MRLPRVELYHEHCFLTMFSPKKPRLERYFSIGDLLDVWSIWVHWKGLWGFVWWASLFICIAVGKWRIGSMKKVRSELVLFVIVCGQHALSWTAG